jgi:hypothetical protein
MANNWSAVRLVKDEGCRCDNWLLVNVLQLTYRCINVCYLMFVKNCIVILLFFVCLFVWLNEEIKQR